MFYIGSRYQPFFSTQTKTLPRSRRNKGCLNLRSITIRFWETRITLTLTSQSGDLIDVGIHVWDTPDMATTTHTYEESPSS
jgi:hypothetical protein